MINRIIVLGGGSAGFMTALALKVKLPAVDVTVIRSKEIGIITVGESSTTALPRFLHSIINVQPKKFYDQVLPTWKMGIKFIWGPRQSFPYSFGPGLDNRIAALPKRLAYYAYGDIDNAEEQSALMAQDRCFPRTNSGGMDMHQGFAYHIENHRYVAFLENYATAIGIKIVEGNVDRVLADESGVAGLVLREGPTLTADLYVDCSGFRSLLIGKTLGGEYESFSKTLFNDRAVVGSWDRAKGEIIKPYTTCETMDCGWCWQIEHVDTVNRGYVYCSSFISDEEAEREFRAKNPKIGDTRIIKFITGAYKRNWVKNVVAIGNASGFVEPLESTALGVIATQARMLVGVLIDTDRQIRPTHAAYYSDMCRRQWETVRSFIAIHYKFNTRLNTPYWMHCRETIDMASAQAYVDFYNENGPSGYWAQLQIEPTCQFGAAGYAALMVGQQVPYQNMHVPTEAEQKIWNKYCEDNRAKASRGFTVDEGLAIVRSSKWVWPAHVLGK